MTQMDKQILGVTAEFAVAAELGRRNIYAQLTLGNQKRVDLLLFGNNNRKLLKVEVKGKNSRSWANLKGLFDDTTLFVFVDYFNKKEDEPPDFYIVSKGDWKKLIEDLYGEGIKKGFIKLDEDGTPTWPAQKTKSGKPYSGAEFTIKDLANHKNKWEKIINRLSE